MKLKRISTIKRRLRKKPDEHEIQMGHDAGSRASGNTYMATGIGSKPRHRKLMGWPRKASEIQL